VLRTVKQFLLTRRDIFFSKLTATFGRLWDYSVRGGFMHTYKYKYEYLTQPLALFQSNPGSFFVGVFFVAFLRWAEQEYS
jgi:hypothetical protein